MAPEVTLAALEQELARQEARIDAAYWTFTRCARGRPPVLAVPDAYQARAKLKETIRAMRGRGCT